MAKSTASANVDLGNIADFIRRIIDQGVGPGQAAGKAALQYLYPWSDPTRRSTKTRVLTLIQYKTRSDNIRQLGRCYRRIYKR